jgi:hypothetical protein
MRPLSYHPIQPHEQDYELQPQESDELAHYIAIFLLAVLLIT